MSLINDMLKDLERQRREQRPARAAAAYSHEDAAPPEPIESPRGARRGQLALQVALTVVVAGGVASWVAHRAPASQSAPAISSAPTTPPQAGGATLAPAAPAAPAAPVAPVVAVPLPAVAPAATATATATTTVADGLAVAPAQASPAEEAAPVAGAPVAASGLEATVPREPPLALAQAPAEPAAREPASSPAKRAPAPVAAPPRQTDPKGQAESKASAQTRTAATDRARSAAQQAEPASPAQGGGSPKAPQAPSPPTREMLAAQADRLHAQAVEHQKQGQADQAMASAQGSLAANPGQVPARLLLASLLVERKQVAQAADLLIDGLMLLPQQTAFIRELAPLWMQTGQQEDAMALLAQGAKIAGGRDPRLHAYYGSQLLRLKRPAEALAQYRLALGSNPEQAEWLVGLGLSLQQLGNLPEAVEALRRASATGKLSAPMQAMVNQVIARLQAQPA